MKKILEAVKRNTMLKVFSVILAILLWAFVQLAQNPEISYDVWKFPSLSPVKQESTMPIW